MRGTTLVSHLPILKTAIVNDDKNCYIVYDKISV